MSGEIRFPIVGNLTADPELRYTQSGLAVASFTIASTPRVYDQTTREMKDGEPAFIRCSVWREFAENVAASLKKGTRVIAFGTYKQRRYQTESGESRMSPEMEVEAIGPDLRWASATVTKGGASSPAAQRPADAWGAPEPTSGGGWDDETPF